MDDDDLARRLAALRIPSSSLTPPVDELEARFQKIFNKTPVSLAKTTFPSQPTQRNHEDGLSIQDLMSALTSSNEETWGLELDVPDSKSISELLAEAKAILPPPDKRLNPGDTDNDKGAGKDKGKDQGSETSGDIPPDWSLDDPTSSTENAPQDWLRSDDTLKSDADEADDILKRIRDELEYEKAHGIVSTSDTEPDQEDEGEKCEDIDQDLLKRFAALANIGVGRGGGGDNKEEETSINLPTVPTLAPSSLGKSTNARFNIPPPPSPPPQDQDNETDTWCCICNADAEYRCSGCDNDIYCAVCLYQAHTGPDAGFEERRHKWTKYTKPKKEKKGRVAAA